MTQVRGDVSRWRRRTVTPPVTSNILVALVKPPKLKPPAALLPSGRGQPKNHLVERQDREPACRAALPGGLDPSFEVPLPTSSASFYHEMESWGLVGNSPDSDTARHELIARLTNDMPEDNMTTRKKAPCRIGLLTTARCTVCHERFQVRKLPSVQPPQKCRRCVGKGTAKPHRVRTVAPDARPGEDMGDYLERKDRENFGIYD